jgi:AcrR family transcriptional regulator
MAARERILESAMKVFGQHGYRLASMELVAQEADLTRQALYHHFASKEALFRAVVEAVFDSACEAERQAGLNAEKAGKGLADVLAAQFEARFRHFSDTVKGAAEAEELLAEHKRQTQDLYQRFAAQKLGLIEGAVGRALTAGEVVLREGLTPAELARAIELVAHGVDLKTAGAGALADLKRSIRLMVAGALAPAAEEPRRRAARSKP